MKLLAVAFAAGMLVLGCASDQADIVDNTKSGAVITVDRNTPRADLYATVMVGRRSRVQPFYLIEPVGTAVMIRTNSTKKYALTNKHVADARPNAVRLQYPNGTIVIVGCTVVKVSTVADAAIIMVDVPTTWTHYVEVAESFSLSSKDLRESHRYLSIIRVFPANKPELKCDVYYRGRGTYFVKHAILPGNSGSGVYYKDKLIGLVYAHHQYNNCVCYVVPLAYIHQLLIQQGLK